ncbi:MAG TPA: hypothetical protein VFD82_20525 [Planctomycetota bacterium]|nr:hypothetical protein [Planctomycetota bacterium]
MLKLCHLAISAVTVLGISLTLPAQCYEPATGVSVGTGDDVVLPMQALGFAFPFGGTTYTNVHPCTNGFVYLSNAGVPAAGGALCCTGTTASLVAGSPKICAYWSDLNVIAPGSVKFNAMPGKAVITWENVVEYGTAAPTFTFQMQLLSTGEILFAYDGRCIIATTGDYLVGMSEGGGAPVPPTADFSTPNVSATTTNYELFNNVGLTFDLTGKTLQLVPAGLGYVWVASNCAGSHTTYGSGCYTTSNSFYQLTTPPAVSAATLNGTAITLFPTPSGYVVLNSGTYVPPTGAAIPLVLTDDSQVATPALTIPFPYPGGTAATLMVCSNGFVSVAGGNGVGYIPTVATMLANTQTAWYAWHDYNPAAVGSGQVKFEQVNPALATITWDGVYNFSGTTVADASTMQFQFDSATGSITIAHVSVSANGHTLPAGEPHLVGYSPAGASSDPGNIAFATALPITVGTIQLVSLALSASPTPVSPSTTTYTTSNIPEFAPSSGLYVALHILSVGQIPPPGIDLGFLGAPGCALNVASLDFVQSMVGASATQSVTFNWPPGLPTGTTLWSQSAALFTPNSLPTGQNAFGATTSNGVTSSVGVW